MVLWKNLTTVTTSGGIEKHSKSGFEKRPDPRGS
jgi:hypothetical protein